MALPNLTARIGLAQIELAQKLVHEIVYRTPIDTGTAIYNWRTDTHGTVDTYGVVNMKLKEVEEVANQRAHELKLADVLRSGTVYIYNNVPYIQALENGHSKQAPAGMVRNSIDKVVTQ